MNYYYASEGRTWPLVLFIWFVVYFGLFSAFTVTHFDLSADEGYRLIGTKHELFYGVTDPNFYAGIPPIPSLLFAAMFFFAMNSVMRRALNVGFFFASLVALPLAAASILITPYLNYLECLGVLFVVILPLTFFCRILRNLFRGRDVEQYTVLNDDDEPEIRFRRAWLPYVKFLLPLCVVLLILLQTNILLQTCAALWSVLLVVFFATYSPPRTWKRKHTVRLATQVALFALPLAVVSFRYLPNDAQFVTYISTPASSSQRRNWLRRILTLQDLKPSEAAVEIAKRPLRFYKTPLLASLKKDGGDELRRRAAIVRLEEEKDWRYRKLKKRAVSVATDLDALSEAVTEHQNKWDNLAAGFPQALAPVFNGEKPDVTEHLGDARWEITPEAIARRKSRVLLKSGDVPSKLDAWEKRIARAEKLIKDEELNGGGLLITLEQHRLAGIAGMARRVMLARLKRAIASKGGGHYEQAAKLEDSVVESAKDLIRLLTGRTTRLAAQKTGGEPAVVSRTRIAMPNAPKLHFDAVAAYSLWAQAENNREVTRALKDSTRPCDWGNPNALLRALSSALPAFREQLDKQRARVVSNQRSFAERSSASSWDPKNLAEPLRRPDS